ncbi:FHA domain-containing protein [Methanobacterium oryzae]|uniref:FHA domain-containing protein n=1 Tax=Methanobacterium oryzae TaxID=69540 RepID=UPI003D2579AA
MSKNKLLIVIAITFISIVILLSINEEFNNWLKFQWLDVLIAAVMAIIAGLIIQSFYRKYSTKSKMEKTTMAPPSQIRKYWAKLVLKDKHEFLIKEYERIFGREDFLGITLTDDLIFIGKKHFKITKEDDGFYIEDLGTKNGTMLNGKEIKELGKRKLQNGDEILVAKILNIKYYEENTNM